MAEILKRQYDLLALKIAMDLAADDPRVCFELQGRSDGSLGLVRDWVCSAREIGLPETLEHSRSLERRCTFSFPDRVLHELKAVLEESEYRDRPLWLHLAKPLGYLNLVPWEQLLVPELNMPLLRLPDFLAKPPRASLNSLDVILCTSLPVAKDPFPAPEQLRRIAGHILGVGPPATTIHVFADSQMCNELGYMFRGLANVRVYDPANAGTLPTAQATTRIGAMSNRISNPWLIWMRDALAGRSIDVVHFLAHGYLSRDQGALAFAESPLHNADRRIARFIGAGELLDFLTQVGAWAAAFSSPPRNFSEIGLRLLADTIAQMRPGPVLHQELRLDPDCESLGRAYDFVFGRGIAQPPVSPALFTYCHPSRLEAQAAATVRAPTRGRRRVSKGAKLVTPFPESASPADDPVTGLYASDENVPAWIAATQRYIEGRRSDVERLFRQGKQAATSKVDAGVISDTMQQIQETLARVAAQSKRSDHG